MFKTASTFSKYCIDCLGEAMPGMRPACRWAYLSVCVCVGLWLIISFPKISEINNSIKPFQQFMIMGDRKQSRVLLIYGLK